MIRPARGQPLSPHPGIPRRAGPLRLEELEPRCAFAAQPVGPWLPPMPAPPAEVVAIQALPAHGVAAPAPAVVTQMAGTVFAMTAGKPADAVVATLQTADPKALQAAIDWGNGCETDGRIAADGAGGWQVLGTATYTQPGTFSVTVRLSAPGSEPLVAESTAEVVTADPPSPEDPGEFETPGDGTGGGGAPPTGSAPPPVSPPPPAPPPAAEEPVPPGRVEPLDSPAGGSGQILWTRLPDPRPDPADGAPRRAPDADDSATGLTAAAGHRGPEPERAGKPDYLLSGATAAAEPPVIPGLAAAYGPTFVRPANRPAGAKSGPPAGGTSASAAATTPDGGHAGEWEMIAARVAPIPVPLHPAQVVAVDEGWFADAGPVAVTPADSQEQGRTSPAWWSVWPWCLLMVLWDRWADAPSEDDSRDGRRGPRRRRAHTMT